MNLETEKPIPLSEVPKLKFIPRRRGGSRLNIATVYRWAQRGLHGHRLETICIGGQKCTSAAALQRFFSALAGNSQPSEQRTSSRRDIEIHRAEAQLAAAGI